MPADESLAIGEIGVQYTDIGIEAIAKARTSLRCQPNLRHEYQHLFALGERMRHRLQIDFGFARACHAIE